MARILAIDDNGDNLISLRAVLMDTFPDAAVSTARSGAEGIEKAIAEDPDVILLDIVMPQMDGFEVCRRLKLDERVKDIPVVFLTALRGGREDRIKALECGAEAFLPKPIEATEITAQVRAMVKVKSANRQKRDEHERLEAMVAERTAELRRSQTAMLNLLEDLKAENETRRKTEAALRESEAKARSGNEQTREEYLDAILQTAQDGFWVVDEEGRITEANAACSRMTGYQLDELRRMKVSDLEALEDAEEVAARIGRIRASGSELFESRHRRKDGSVYDVEVSISWLGKDINRFVTFCRDITERKLAEKRILDLLQEKETLLREVHHRIKNNMETVYSLLSIQASLQEGEEARAVLQDAAGRIQSMKVLYDRLYRSELTGSASIADYLPRLIAEILGIFPQKDSVKVETRIDDIVLGVGTLSPLGIIMNELVTNAMKYSLSGGGGDTITVTASRKDGGFSMSFEDNGPGIPESVSFEESTGFGLRLVGVLVRQINGSISIDRRAGARFILDFET